MSTYTITLEELAEFHNIELVGLRNYPIWDEGYRLSLNKKIIDRYWTREIGLETPNMFFHHLKRKMNEIMPYYNKLYLTEQIKYDPLTNISMSTLNEQTSTDNTGTESTADQNATSTSSATALDSNTPQTQLSGHEHYANALNKSDSEGTSQGSGHEVASTERESKGLAQSLMEGRQGSGTALVMEFRASLLNIDVMVVNDLSDLFMGVWNNADVEPYPQYQLHSMLNGWNY